MHQDSLEDILGPDPAPPSPATTPSTLFRPNAAVAAPQPSRYSPALQLYIDTFRNKPTFKSQIEALLTAEERAAELPDEFLDPITLEVMNIPVILNGRTYDLKTLERLAHSDPRDPFTRAPFSQNDIQENSSRANEIRTFANTRTTAKVVWR